MRSGAGSADAGAVDRDDADPALTWRPSDPPGVGDAAMGRLQQVGVLARLVATEPENARAWWSSD